MDGKRLEKGWRTDNQSATTMPEVGGGKENGKWVKQVSLVEGVIMKKKIKSRREKGRSNNQ